MNAKLFSAESAGHHVLVRRFTPWSRLTHAVLALSVYGLVFTGMPLKFAGAFWAAPLLKLWGGPRGAGIAHRFFAVMLFGAGAMHLGAVLLAAARKELPPLFGPDSLLPRPEDLRQFLQYLRHLLGRDLRPAFDRYTYWEKFDYFAVFWGLVIIGSSGLVMWFPETVTRFLPGWVVNAALVIHSDEALLAAGFLFAIHFFNTHLRPGAFPLDPVIFSGFVPLEELREERPGWYRRLLSSGQLARISAPARSPVPLPALLAGIFFLSLGLVMLALIMWAAIAEVLRYLGALL